MSDITTNWLARYEVEAKRRRKRLSPAKAAILAALKTGGIAHVSVEYDGEGDSGQITGITGTDAAGQPRSLSGSIVLNLDGKRRKYSLTEALDAFAWLILDLYHEGFENNEGGFGTLEIDVANGTVTLDHSDRIIEVSNTLTEV